MKNKSKRAEGYEFVEDKQCERQLFESQKKFVLTGMNIRELESLIETLGEKNSGQNKYNNGFIRV